MCKAVMELKQEGIDLGLQQGIERGMQQGMQQGIQQTHLRDIKNITNKLGVSIDEALKILEIPENEWEKYKSMLE